MNTNTLKLLVACTLLVLTAGSQAASISLVATSPTTGVGNGDLVTFDVVMDFSTDTNGLGSDITLGGGFDVVWDSSKLGFVGFTSASLGDPSFGRDPDVFPGLLESWGFADFNGLTGPSLVGTVTLQVLSMLGADSTFLGTAPTNGIAGPFVSGIDFITILNVDYNSVEVSGVPLPAAFWFLMSGLGAVFGLGRRAS